VRASAAPRRATAAWPAHRQGTGLYDHAIKGFTGTAGMMPAKGGRVDVSDDLVKEAVEHIVGMSK
jgi:cytochrome c5